MFGNAFSGWHLVIILFVILLLFGAPKLPGLARSIGQSMKIFKKEVSDLGDSKDGKADSSADAAAGETTDAPAEKKND